MLLWYYTCILPFAFKARAVEDTDIAYTHFSYPMCGSGDPLPDRIRADSLARHRDSVGYGHRGRADSIPSDSYGPPDGHGPSGGYANANPHRSTAGPHGDADAAHICPARTTLRSGLDGGA